MNVSCSVQRSSRWRGRTWTHRWPISSEERLPAFTRLGGWLGLRGLASVLSYAMRMWRTDPRGRDTGCAHR